MPAGCESQDPNTTSDFDELLAILDLNRVGDDVFIGSHPSKNPMRTFGGQLMAQSLVASSRNSGSVVGLKAAAGAGFGAGGAVVSEAAVLLDGAVASPSEATAVNGRRHTARIPAQIRVETEIMN